MADNPEHSHLLEIQLASRGGGIGCSLLCLALALAILVPVVLGLLGIIKIDESRWVFLIYLPFVLILAWIGKSVFTNLALQKVSLDRKRRTVTEQYGAGTGKTRVRERSFDDLDTVLLQSHTNLSKQTGGSTTYYDVALRFGNQEKEDSASIRIGSFAEDYFAARELAERVAKFCLLSLEDSAMGKETVVRSTEDLDLNLKEKAGKNGPDNLFLRPPPDLRAIIRDRGGRVEILFPPYKLQIGCFFCLGFVVLWLAFTIPSLIKMLSPSGGKAPGVGTFDFTVSLIMVAVPSLLTLFFLLLAKGRRQKLIIGARTVKHEKYRILPRKRITLPRETIEEIIMGRGTLMDQGPFIIRGDREQIVIENTVMSKAERAYLRNFIENRLSR